MKIRILRAVFELLFLAAVGFACAYLFLLAWLHG